MNSSHKETILCPSCNNKQEAEVLHTEPFFSYVHTCLECRYVITESEWDSLK